MVTKDPRFSRSDDEVDAERSKHQAYAESAHRSANSTVAMKYDASPPKAPTRTIPSANQVAALKAADSSQYEMWKEYRREKD